MDKDGSPPDVTVVIAVYNTMPYLTACLDSLVAQTIGRDRMEVVLIDDGSTDSCPAELARFAGLHPDTFTVITQENSGGPAAPQNRGLDRATGRYVFMLGADDHLGPEALERLVATADANRSDIVLGRMVGVNGRLVPKAVFAQGNRSDIGLTDSALPWALGDTKLFRRSLLERHGIRYNEDLTILCDQPFTLEAVLRASRISVLADYPCYYALRREDESNLTFRGSHDALLRGVERAIRTALDVGPTPEQRAAFLHRYVSNEFSEVLTERIPATPDRGAQQQLLGRVGRLVEEFVDEELLERLSPLTRIRMLVARARALDPLLESIAFEKEHPEQPTLVSDGRVYLDHPCFRNAGLYISDRHFDVTRSGLTGTAVSWQESSEGETVLLVSAHSPAPDYVDLWGRGLRAEAVRVHTGSRTTAIHELDTAFRSRTDGSGTTTAVAGTTVEVRIPLTRLLADWTPGSGRWSIAPRLKAGEFDVGFPVTARSPAARKLWSRGRLYRVTPTADRNGHLLFAIAPVRVSRVIAQRLRRLRAIGRK